MGWYLWLHDLAACAQGGAKAHTLRVALRPMQSEAPFTADVAKAQGVEQRKWFEQACAPSQDMAHRQLWLDQTARFVTLAQLPTLEAATCHFMWHLVPMVANNSDPDRAAEAIQAPDVCWRTKAAEVQEKLSSAHTDLTYGLDTLPDAVAIPRRHLTSLSSTLLRAAQARGTTGQHRPCAFQRRSIVYIPPVLSGHRWAQVMSDRAQVQLTSHRWNAAFGSERSHAAAECRSHAYSTLLLEKPSQTLAVCYIGDDEGMYPQITSTVQGGHLYLPPLHSALIEPLPRTDAAQGTSDVEVVTVWVAGEAWIDPKLRLESNRHKTAAGVKEKHSTIARAPHRSRRRKSLARKEAGRDSWRDQLAWRKWHTALLSWRPELQLRSRSNPYVAWQPPPPTLSQQGRAHMLIIVEALQERDVPSSHCLSKERAFERVAAGDPSLLALLQQPLWWPRCMALLKVADVRDGSTSLSCGTRPQERSSCIQSVHPGIEYLVSSSVSTALGLSPLQRAPFFLVGWKPREPHTFTGLKISPGQSLLFPGRVSVTVSSPELPLTAVLGVPLANGQPVADALFSIPGGIGLMDLTLELTQCFKPSELRLSAAVIAEAGSPTWVKAPLHLKDGGFAAPRPPPREKLDCPPHEERVRQRVKHNNGPGPLLPGHWQQALEQAQWHACDRVLGQTHLHDIPTSRACTRLVQDMRLNTFRIVRNLPIQASAALQGPELGPHAVLDVPAQRLLVYPKGVHAAPLSLTGRALKGLHHVNRGRSLSGVLVSAVPQHANRGLAQLQRQPVNDHHWPGSLLLVVRSRTISMEHQVHAAASEDAAGIIIIDASHDCDGGFDTTCLRGWDPSTWSNTSKTLPALLLSAREGALLLLTLGHSTTVPKYV